MLRVSLLNFTGVRCFQNAPRCRVFLDVRRKGREFTEGGTGDGVKEEKERVKEKERERELSRKRVCVCVCPTGGEMVSHFLCFGGSGLISPSVTSVSLAVVTVCYKKSFKWRRRNRGSCCVWKKQKLYRVQMFPRHREERRQKGRTTGLDSV